MNDDEPPDETDEVLAAVAALGDPLRRRLYRFVGAQDHAVSRDQVAEGAGVSRSRPHFTSTAWSTRDCSKRSSGA
jgi:hypothetical protein